MVRRRVFFPKRVVIQMIVAPVIIVLVAMLFVFGIHSTVQKPVVFTISRGDTVSGVANRLLKAKLIDSTQVFKMSVRLQGGKIQTGQYDIPIATSTWRIADMFANGRVASTTIVIPEGLTIKQKRRRIDAFCKAGFTCGKVQKAFSHGRRLQLTHKP